jgi:hypothetical protein
MGAEPECAKLLTQTEISLRAIRLHRQLSAATFAVIRAEYRARAETSSRRSDDSAKAVSLLLIVHLTALQFFQFASRVSLIKVAI